MGLATTAKLDQNPENTVGVLTMAGNRVDVLVTPTRDTGRLLAVISAVEMQGKCDFISGLQVAQVSVTAREQARGQISLLPLACTDTHCCAALTTRSLPPARAEA